MRDETSRGHWLRLRRRTLDLTQEALAGLVGCSTDTIRNIEAERRRPSQQIAERMAACLAIDSRDHQTFVKWIRGESQLRPRTEEEPDPAPPRAGAATPLLKLPAPTTPLIGRADLLASGCAEICSVATRLLTLTGVGGVGKTRLALEIARLVCDAFEDGAAFVALDSVSRAEMVVPAIGRVLGLNEQGSAQLDGSLRSFFGAKRFLLVLDNFEHVIAAAPAIAGLLAAAPGLTVLVTSRQPLHIYGERELAVPPMGLPELTWLPPVDDLLDVEAVRPFVERVQAIRPDFRVAVASARAVAEICYRLDGLPLAIELAAAWSKLLSPAAILSRLKQSLENGPVDRPPRHRALSAAFDWSFRLLDPLEQRLFARLAVCAGGCSLAAAQAICNAPQDLPDDLLPLLASLVDKSLLEHEEQEGEPRLRMLQTVREYALEQLERRGESLAIHRQHACYYLALAEQAADALRGPDQLPWLARLEREHNNLRAAFEWALSEQASDLALRFGAALWRFWYAHSHLSEGRQWLSAALAGTALAAPALRAEVMYGAGVLAAEQGDLGPAEELFRAGLEIRRELDDRSVLSDSLLALGNLAHFRGDLDQARASYEEALALQQQLEPERISAWTLNNLGVVALGQGDYRRAAEMHEQSLAIWQQEGDKHGMAAGTSNVARLAAAQNDRERAHQFFARSLALWWEVGNRAGVAECLEGLASVACLWPGSADSKRRNCLFASRLWGAAEAIRLAIASPLQPGDRSSYEEAIKVAQAYVEEETFKAAWREGQALRVKQAIAIALDGDLGRLS